MERAKIVLEAICHCLGMEDPEQKRDLEIMMELYMTAVQLDMEQEPELPGEEKAKPKKSKPKKPEQSAGGTKDDRPSVSLSADSSPCTGELLQRKTGKSGAASAAQEKRRIYERLRAFREERGIGCFVQLSRACKLDDITIGRMHSGERFPIENWRILAEGLDALEQKEEAGK